ncbi:MAG: hypothetical protein RR549_01895 [Oscillospiraceae bacterium]
MIKTNYDTQNNIYSAICPVFINIKPDNLDLNLLISDVVCYHETELSEFIFKDNYGWLSIEQLFQLIKNRKISYIWGVVSCFKKDITLEEILKHPLPFSNGYAKFDDHLSSLIHHPFACVEITPWDNENIIITSNDETIFNNIINNLIFEKHIDDITQYQKLS